MSKTYSPKPVTCSVTNVNKLLTDPDVLTWESVVKALLLLPYKT